MLIGCTESLFKPSEVVMFCDASENFEMQQYYGDYIDYNCSGKYEELYDIECRRCNFEDDEYYNEYHLSGCSWERYVDHVCKDLDSVFRFEIKVELRPLTDKHSDVNFSI